VPNVSEELKNSIDK